MGLGFKLLTKNKGLALSLDRKQEEKHFSERRMAGRKLSRDRIKTQIGGASSLLENLIELLITIFFLLKSSCFLTGHSNQSRRHSILA